MSRRGYGGMYSSGRRPRTKLYDCNYSMGESYYKPTLDQLDRKQFGIVRNEPPPAAASTIPARDEPRQRPLSMADIDSSWADEARFHEDADREVEGMLARVRSNREASSLASGVEKSFDSALSRRSAETKRRFAEKMLDTVGINGESEDSKTTTRSQLMRVEDPKWPSIPETGESAAELAARSRARATRARLADLDAEMSQVEERGFARDRRAAAIRQVLADESDSFRLSKKVTITEKRTAAY